MVSEVGREAAERLLPGSGTYVLLLLGGQATLAGNMVGRTAGTPHRSRFRGGAQRHPTGRELAWVTHALDRTPVTSTPENGELTAPVRKVGAVGVFAFRVQRVAALSFGRQSEERREVGARHHGHDPVAGDLHRCEDWPGRGVALLRGLSFDTSIVKMG